MSRFFELSPLLAADIVQTIFAVIVFILWAIGQLMGSKEEAKRNKRQRPRPKPVDLADEPLEGPPAGPRQPRNQEEALRSEVEDFLRRAQGKPKQPPPPSKPKQLPPLRPDRGGPDRGNVATESQPVAPTVSRPFPVQQPSRQQRRQEGVAEPVLRQLDKRDLKTRDSVGHSQTLGDKVALADVALADDRMEAHLHEKFDHELGNLQHQDSPEPTRQTEDIAAEIASMLSNPRGVRQLIIANEILRRPDW